MCKLNANDVIQEIINKLNLSARDAEMFIHDVNNLRGHEWLEEVEGIGDPCLFVKFKVICNIIDEPDETDGEYDNYPTEQKYFVYDNDDNCVSDYGFNFEDGAIAFANSNNYPVVKIHRYYRDPERGYKIYPDGDPEIVWKNGKPVMKGE